MSDLISRQAAIDAIKMWGLLDGLSEGQAIEILADAEKLPSAEKTGEWILDGGTPICSVCREEPCWSSEGYDFTDYCPNCGARMLGEDGEA